MGQICIQKECSNFYLRKHTQFNNLFMMCCKQKLVLLRLNIVYKIKAESRWFFF